MPFARVHNRAEGWTGVKSVSEIGIKITAAQREYYRYTGPAAELEQRGTGSSRPELAWVRRAKTQTEDHHKPEDQNT
jgi:hypothetical protein